MNINAERKALLTSTDAAAQLNEAQKTMKTLIDYLKNRYNDNNNNLDLKKAMIDMGLKITFNPDSSSNSILVEGNQLTTFSVKFSEGTRESFDALTRLLGVYLFTNELKDSTFFTDRELLKRDEDKLNSFQLLVNIPDLNFTEYVSMDQLVQWSIEAKVPLPVLRGALSI